MPRDTPNIDVSCDTTRKEFLKWYLIETVYIIISVVVIAVGKYLLFGIPLLSGENISLVYIVFLYPPMVLIWDNAGPRKSIGIACLLTIFFLALNVDISITGSISIH